MRKPKTALAVISVLIAGFALVPALYAHDSQSSRGSMMGPDMMGQGGMMNMMNMMGQMGQTGQMSQMMEQCSQMMQGAAGGDSGKPNEQWRKDAPAIPEQKG